MSLKFEIILCRQCGGRETVGPDNQVCPTCKGEGVENIVRARRPGERRGPSIDPAIIEMIENEEE
jgi:hypothetical protein